MGGATAAGGAKAASGPCPICGKPVDRRYRPFCSRRCADIDLGRWLKGAYALPASPDEDREDGGNESEGTTRGG